MRTNYLINFFFKSFFYKLFDFFDWTPPQKNVFSFFFFPDGTPPPTRHYIYYFFWYSPVQMPLIKVKKSNNSVFIYTVLLSNLSHQRDSTVPHRTALYCMWPYLKKILSLHCSWHLPLLFTPLQGPLHQSLH